MKTTPDDFEKLTDAQQEAFAEVVLVLSRKRQELRMQARGYPGFTLLPVLVGIAGPVVFLVFPAYPALPLSAFLVLFALIQFHATGLNRRVDALLELSKDEAGDPRTPATGAQKSDESRR